ncbi:MAG: hypothetical protein WC961_07260 [Anaerovoracaceae bacterium]|jgi:hypothetical protein
MKKLFMIFVLSFLFYGVTGEMVVEKEDMFTIGRFIVYKASKGYSALNMETGQRSLYYRFPLVAINKVSDNQQ